MLKRFIRSTILSVVLVVSVSGCIGDDKEGSSTSIPDSNSTDMDNTSGKIVLESLEIKTNLSTNKPLIQNKNIIDHKGYKHVRGDIRAIAKYSDGSKKEITDHVKWIENNVRVQHSGELRLYFRKEGYSSLQARYDDIESNVLNFEVKNEEDPFIIRIRNNQKSRYGLGRSADIVLKMTQRPSSDVRLVAHLDENSRMSFNEKGALEQSIVLEAKKWNERSGSKRFIHVYDLDTNNSNYDDFFISFSATESSDSRFDNINIEKVLIHKDEKPYLFAPPIDQLRGAIAGSEMKFRIVSQELDLNYTLIDAPEGVSIIEPTRFLGQPGIYSFSGVDLKWDIPKDIKEGTYNITVNAKDIENKENNITFSIHVPKTTIIPTKVENNELIVTDKNSRLFGMKMRGHNGEDISHMVLKSVDYLDVWNKKLKLEPGDVPEYLPFVIYGKPSELEIDLPQYPDNLITYLNRYKNEKQVGSNDYWKDIRRRYTRDENGNFIPQRNEFDDGGNKVYLLILNDTTK